MGAVVVSLKWLALGGFALTRVAFTLIGAAVTFVLVYEEVSRRLRRRRRRSAANAKRRLRRDRQRRLSQLLKTIPEVPYQQVVAAAADGHAGGRRIFWSPCVVCRGKYEAGERCAVLPRCAHTLHKACIAKWLRHHTTCPVCGAEVAAPGEQGSSVVQGMA
ncbi:hypothetical protein ACP70R_020329 [Stipagrostis hirtigluma subsp. patula]